MTCSKCEKDKPETEFHRQRNGRFPWCKACRKSYDKNYHSKSRDLVLVRKGKIRERNRRFIVDFLSDKACETCGEDDIRVLDFAHRDSSTKKFNVSEATRLLYGLGTLQNEIDKCKILCANCHRRETAEERGYYRNGV